LLLDGVQMDLFLLIVADAPGLERARRSVPVTFRYEWHGAGSEMALLFLMWPPVCVVRFSSATIGTGVNFFLGSFDSLSVAVSFATLIFRSSYSKVRSRPRNSISPVFVSPRSFAGSTISPINARTFSRSIFKSFRVKVLCSFRFELLPWRYMDSPRDAVIF